MENSQLQTNLKFVDLLNQWNPFQLEEGSYDTEIADTIQAIHEIDHPSALAEKIQCIYEFSFEEIIPIDSCLEIARKLLVIKNSDSCTI
jgi:hypothetical protein